MAEAMTIEMLKKMKDGTFTGDFEFSIKTKKKCFQAGNDWLHTIVLCDKKGEIIADVLVGDRYAPINAQVIQVIDAIVQDVIYLNKPIKKLYIDKFTVPTTIGDDFMGYDPFKDLVVRGKCKCILLARMFDQNTNSDNIGNILKVAQSEEMVKLIDEIIKG